MGHQHGSLSPVSRDVSLGLRRFFPARDVSAALPGLWAEANHFDLVAFTQNQSRNE